MKCRKEEKKKKVCNFPPTVAACFSPILLRTETNGVGKGEGETERGKGEGETTHMELNFVSRKFLCKHFS